MAMNRRRSLERPLADSQWTWLKKYRPQSYSCTKTNPAQTHVNKEKDPKLQKGAQLS